MTDWFCAPRPARQERRCLAPLLREPACFTSPWRYDEEGRARVAQVDRQGCALILANNLAPEKIGQGVIFISLNGEPATPEAAVAALDVLRAELEAKSVPVKEGSWGYRLLVVDDLDGNQLLFNYPSEAASANIAGDEDNV
jgi:hypothetical protein